MAKKIMVVDDDQIIVKYLVSLFTDNGYETCTAENGIQAYDIVKKEKPDLITLDLEMPEQWGPQFFRKLTKNKELKDIPIIVISGLDGDHALRNPVAFIRKPFDKDQLLGIVKKTIG